VIEWADPLLVAGHWVPDIVRRAGGRDVLGAAGQPARPVSVDELRQSGVEVLIFAPCGADLHESAAMAGGLLAQPVWEWARSRRTWAVDSRSLTGRPGPRLVDGVETFARILHPALFSPLDPQSAVLLTPAARAGSGAVPAV
jgi:iron complex transport system substrate-binding protein